MDENNNVTKIKINLISILIGCIGFITSLYALVLHIQNLLQPNHGALCDLNAKFNCSNVISSSYGEIASIPLGSYGMTYFIIIIAAAILPKIALVTKKELATLEFIIGFVGFIIVVSLFYISHSILKTICPTCTIVHILTTVYFIIKSITFLKHKNDNDVNSGSDYLLRFVAVCICLGIPPLAAGLVAPIIIEKFFPSAKKVTQENSPIATPVTSLSNSKNEVTDTNSNSINFKLFNKTNYAGDGEDYRRGSDDAKTVVQVFSDFGCPHCKDANTPLVLAQDRIGQDKVVIVYRFFPLSNKCNPYVPSEGWYQYSCILPQASRCAGAQGRFWDFKEWGFSGQNWSDEERAQKFSMEGLKEEAKNLGLNVKLFTECLESKAELTKIKNDSSIANKFGIKGTPLIIINGQEYTGPHNVDSFARAMSN
jgi:protein-disulfide isomerase/uncharacterized membrane protein